jgi:hypothetical protein
MGLVRYAFGLRQLAVMPGNVRGPAPPPGPEFHWTVQEILPSGSTVQPKQPGTASFEPGHRPWPGRVALGAAFVWCDGTVGGPKSGPPRANAAATGRPNVVATFVAMHSVLFADCRNCGRRTGTFSAAVVAALGQDTAGSQDAPLRAGERRGRWIRTNGKQLLHMSRGDASCAPRLVSYAWRPTLHGIVKAKAHRMFGGTY